MTEKETEAYLEQETRILRMPGGEEKPIRHFRIVWNSFDLIVKCGAMSDETLIDIAAENSAETGQPFEESLERVCGYVHRELKKM